MNFLITRYNNDNNDNNIEKTNNHQDNIECLICLERTCEEDIFPSKLNSNAYYIKNCECDGYIHKSCLDLWYNNNQECPICRNTIKKRSQLSILLFRNNRYILFLYLTIQNNTTKIIKILHFFMFFHYYFFLLYFIFKTIYY